MDGDGDVEHMVMMMVKMLVMMLVTILMMNVMLVTPVPTEGTARDQVVKVSLRLGSLMLHP